MSHVCPSWLSFVLYNPIRKTFTDRKKVLDESGIRADSVVLEIGPGNGFLTEAIAGRARKVVSVELQPGMVKKLNKRVMKFGGKVKLVTADIASHSAGDSFADVCLLYYCFHEIKNQDGAVINISRAIKPGGILAIYEPGVEVNKVKMERTVGMFENAGFKKESEHKTLFTRFARLRKLPA
ncbi:MAG: class I SAM-dependent methyltransferase [Nitrospirae bacterium]|nr:class I SAM-dependent methyltransferase [Nitrospirota bacterium]